MSLMLYFGEPIIASLLPAEWVHPATSLVALLLCSPFLWMLLRAGGDDPDVDKLWYSGARWRIRITAYALLRLFITVAFVSCFVDYAMPRSSWFGIFALIAIMFIIYYSRHLEKRSKRLTKNFTENLSAREKMNEEKRNEPEHQ